MNYMKSHRPTPAMLVALLALFISMGGGSYAAINLGKNSVGTKQIKGDAVTSEKVKDGTLLANDFKVGQLEAGSQGPTGASATAYWAVVNPAMCYDGSCSSLPRSSGISAVFRTGVGTFTVTFTQNVSNCADIATIGQLEGGSQTEGGQISTLRDLGNGTQVFVDTYDKTGTAADRWFHVAVFC